MLVAQTQPRWISGSVFPDYAFDVYVSITKRFSFLFYFFKQIFDQTLTGCIFLNTTPNKLILFPTSLKYGLVYSKISSNFFQKQLFVLF